MSSTTLLRSIVEPSPPSGKYILSLAAFLNHAAMSFSLAEPVLEPVFPAPVKLVPPIKLCSAVNNPLASPVKPPDCHDNYYLIFRSYTKDLKKERKKNNQIT